MPTLRIAAAGDLHADERTARESPKRSSRSRRRRMSSCSPATSPRTASRMRRRWSRLRAPVSTSRSTRCWEPRLPRGAVPRVTSLLEAAGVVVLERSWTIASMSTGHRLGIAGTKGFVGGFPGSTLPDFGEPLLRRVYAETGRDVAALDRGLAEIADCRLRVALLHYSPTMSTLAGEPDRSGRTSARTGSTGRSRSTTPTSSSTGTRTPGRSPARRPGSGLQRRRPRHAAATSSSSSSTRTRPTARAPGSRRPSERRRDSTPAAAPPR